jgi:hypothetical protein
MSKTVIIVGAIAGAKGITLYHEDGKETNLTLEGWRTKNIMDQVTPLLAKYSRAEIDLSNYDVHAVIEKKTKGLISFVREKVSSVRTWFKPSAEDKTSKDVEAFTPTAVAEGHTYGVPAAAPEAETVVAIIGNTRLPGVEALEKHIEHAVETGSTEGVENFMKRCAAVIDKRGHSIQELLNFMRKGDLPIATDGSIIAYKVLKTWTIDGAEFIVDCHSKKVKQKLGSRVVMDPKLVDPSRRTECSSGLHIARRGYLNHFSGDTIMMVKIAPEDVIAVPMGEPDKMRVAAYHIVGQIPPNVHAALRSNRPMTGDSTASKMLADVLAGNHVPVLEEVRITEAKGGGVVITPLWTLEQPIVEGINGEAKALDDVKQASVTVKEIKAAARAAAPDAPAPETEITTQHVQMINGDLHIDGEKLETETVVQRAAKTGDMSAAIIAPKVKAKKPKHTPLEELTKLADKPLPEKHANALKLHGEGKSNRQIEAELHICRKTLKKLFDARGLTANG